MTKTTKPAKKAPASKRVPKSDAGTKEAPQLGRPSGYKPEFCKVAESMARLGATDVEVADAIGVDVRTLYRWKGQFEDFCRALKVGKEVADERVERSLFARANGYEHDEVDIRVVAGAIVQTPIRKFYPPDTVAAIFWLKNRRPDLWRDKTDHEVSGKNGGPVAVAAVDVGDLSAEQLRALASIAVHAG